MFAAFMHNQDHECQRVITVLQSECTNNPLINANLYFRGFKLVKVSRKTLITITDLPSLSINGRYSAFREFLFKSSAFLIYCEILPLFPNFTGYSRTPLIRPPSESHWCGRIRGMVAREGFVYEQKPLSVTRNVVV